jgi:hypothetical protein
MRRGTTALIYRRHWREYGAAIRFAAILGLAFGTAAGAAVIEPPLTGALFGAVSAVTDFVTGMAMIGALEIFVPRAAVGRRALRAGGPRPAAAARTRDTDARVRGARGRGSGLTQP